MGFKKTIFDYLNSYKEADITESDHDSMEHHSDNQHKVTVTPIHSPSLTEIYAALDPSSEEFDQSDLDYVLEPSYNTDYILEVLAYNELTTTSQIEV